jgi:hypothetical protein
VLFALGTVAAFVALVVALLWNSERWLGRRPALALQSTVFIYFAYTIAAGIVHCAAEPVYIAPTEAEAAAGSDGKMRFNCDSAGGVYDRLYLYFIGPLMLVALGTMVVRTWRKGRPT